MGNASCCVSGTIKTRLAPPHPLHPSHVRLRRSQRGENSNNFASSVRLPPFFLSPTPGSNKSAFPRRWELPYQASARWKHPRRIFVNSSPSSVHPPPLSEFLPLNVSPGQSSPRADELSVPKSRRMKLQKHAMCDTRVIRRWRCNFVLTADSSVVVSILERNADTNSSLSIPPSWIWISSQSVTKQAVQTTFSFFNFSNYSKENNLLHMCVCIYIQSGSPHIAI